MKLRPKHTFESVVSELTEGLGNGTITLSGAPDVLRFTADDVVTNANWSEWGRFLRYKLDSFASEREFEDELEAAVKGATKRIWFHCADLGLTPAEIALIKQEHSFLDTRIIVPWDAIESNKLFTSYARVLDGYAYRSECLQKGSKQISLWLIIIDSVAYCRFQELSHEWRATFNGISELQNWNSLIFKIDDEDSASFKMCEQMFRSLWDNEIVTKPAIRSLEK
jgi:hypothetical protein